MDGRDRSRSPHGSGVDEEVLNLIVQREQARWAKDFTSADALRDALKARGVELYDKTSTWKTSDGKSGRIPTFKELESGATAESLQLDTPGSMPVPSFGGVVTDSDPTAAHIKQMIQMREQARGTKDFAGSDKIRDELRAMGVEIYDKEKLWKAKTGQSGIIVGFRGAQGPSDVEISTLVLQREKARQSGDYATSDMIRTELKVYGVEIFDKDKTWKAPNGRSGQVPSWGSISALGTAVSTPAAAGMLAGVGGKGGAMDLQAQLMQAAMNVAKDPVRAARTLQVLQEADGIGPVNQVATMPIMPGIGTKPATVAIQPSIASPEAGDALTFITQCQAAGRPATDAEIEWLVTVREKLRQSKDFASADEIRNQMRGTLGIELYEKEKRWAANDGRQGVIPMWGQL